MVSKYPRKTPAEVLNDLVATTPGEEGKWFAAAKDAGLFDEAIDLANRSPCAPQTLTRAARDFAEKNPPFAVEAGIAALKWLVAGYGYEVTSEDVVQACAYTLAAAKLDDRVAETRARISRLVVTAPSADGFVTKAVLHWLDRPGSEPVGP